jgi:hypothetical protein
VRKNFQNGVPAMFHHKNTPVFILPTISQESEISNTVILTVGKWTSLICLVIYHVKNIKYNCLQAEPEVSMSRSGPERVPFSQPTP